jgi:hypothetical protein
MMRLESFGRKQRIEGNPRQVVGWTNTFKINLLIPRRRSQPQLACPVHYKYRAPVFIIHHLSSFQRELNLHMQLQAVAVLVHVFL